MSALSRALSWFEQQKVMSRMPNFFAAVYALEKHFFATEAERVGQDGIPSKEKLRFKADLHLGFPGAPLSDLSQGGNEQQLDMQVSFMGLTGPSGILPRHYTELLMQRVRLKDTGIRDFLDIFNHRLISLFYRSWKKHRLISHFESGLNDDLRAPQSDTCSQILATLTGTDDPLAIYYAGIFNRMNRSEMGLRCLVADFTGCRVSIEPMKGAWLGIAPEFQTRLAGQRNPKGQFARLGKEAMLGSKHWDINKHCRLVLTPVDAEHCQTWLPGSQKRNMLEALIQAYLGNDIQYELRVKLNASSMPAMKLASQYCGLGQNSLLTTSSTKTKSMLV